MIADVRCQPKQEVHYGIDVETPNDELVQSEYNTNSIFVKTDVTEGGH